MQSQLVCAPSDSHGLGAYEPTCTPLMHPVHEPSKDTMHCLQELRDSSLAGSPYSWMHCYQQCVLLKAQLHGSGSSSNLNYITKACQKPLCAQCVCALYAYTLELIVEVTFQITHTQKHSRARVIIAYQ